MNNEALKFPIGRFVKPEVISSQLLQGWILDIELFPKKLNQMVFGLTDEQLDTVYRPQGWTIRQVVHHCADSHMNSFIRFKLTLTEDTPTIKPYFEDRWAELIDSKNYRIYSSLQIIEGVHERWSILLRHLKEEDLKRAFIHPEHSTTISLEENIGIYAWHCNHHLGHIETLMTSKGW